MPTTFKVAQATLRPLGVILRRTGYGPEVRVNFRGGREAKACYTDDLDDALATGRENGAVSRCRPHSVQAAVTAVCGACGEAWPQSPA